MSWNLNKDLVYILVRGREGGNQPLAEQKAATQQAGMQMLQETSLDALRKMECFPSELSSHLDRPKCPSFPIRQASALVTSRKRFGYIAPVSPGDS